MTNDNKVFTLHHPEVDQKSMRWQKPLSSSVPALVGESNPWQAAGYTETKFITLTSSVKKEVYDQAYVHILNSVHWVYYYSTEDITKAGIATYLVCMGPNFTFDVYVLHTDSRYHYLGHRATYKAAAKMCGLG